MKNNPQRKPFAAQHRADAMTQIDFVAAPCAQRRAVTNCEDHRIAAPQRDHRGTRLHARALLRENELAASEILFRFPEQNRGLQREDVLAVEILVQAIVVARPVFQKERRRPRLSGVVAARQEGRKAGREADGIAGCSPLSSPWLTLGLTRPSIMSRSSPLHGSTLDSGSTPRMTCEHIKANSRSANHGG